MDTAKLVSLILLACSSAAWAANDFSTDPNCIAWWRLENGALTTDSTTNGNTLTNVGVSADTGNYREGAASGLWEQKNNDEMYRNDGDLSANFPLRSDSTNTTFSVTFWAYPESLDAPLYHFCWSKGNSLDWNAGDAIRCANVAAGTMYILQFTGGQATAGKDPMSVDHWYFVGLAYNKVTANVLFHVWDYSANDVLPPGDQNNDVSKSGSKVLYTDPFKLGSAGTNTVVNERWDGNLDEFTVWDRALTRAEFDLIRQGLYTGVSARAHTMRLVED